MGRGGDSTASLHDVYQHSVGPDGGGFWQNVLHGIVLRRAPSQSRLRSILTSWFDLPPKADENLFIQHVERPTIGRYSSAAPVASTRPGSVNGVDSDGDNGGGTSSGRSSGTAQQRALPSPARLHTYGVSALKDAPCAFDGEQNTARRSLAREASRKGATSTAVEPSAQTDATACTAVAPEPRLQDTSTDARSKSEASSTASTEVTDQPGAGLSPRLATEQTAPPSVLASDAEAPIWVKEDGLKAASGFSSPRPASHITMCCDCAQPIVGAVFMLNDRSYCCQRHRLNAYHREERARMTERDERITRSLPLHRSPSRPWSKPEPPSSPTGVSPTEPAATSGASGISALFPAWI